MGLRGMLDQIKLRLAGCARVCERAAGRGVLRYQESSQPPIPKRRSLGACGSAGGIVTVVQRESLVQRESWEGDLEADVVRDVELDEE